MGSWKSWIARSAFFSALFILTPALRAQTLSERQYYARLNTFGVFGAYSGDSSHMLLGAAQNRKLLFFGFSYSRRLLLNHVVNWQYNAEFMPVALESDPVVHTVYHETSPYVGTYSQDTRQSPGCVDQSGSFDETFPGGNRWAYTYVTTCERQWSMGQAMSPAGMQWNFRPRRSIQPFITAHGGYMYSTQQIPVEGAGSFNFTFELAAGVEVYRSRTRSIRAEYRYHHISNNDSAHYNPGIDSGLLQVSYAFGR
jgi:hypothetical protein